MMCVSTAKRASLRTSMCGSNGLLLALLASFWISTNHALTIELPNKVNIVGELEPFFASFTTDPVDVMTIDFGPSLTTALSAVAPAIWRIGGSHSDSLYYTLADIDMATFDGPPPSTSSEIGTQPPTSQDTMDPFEDDFNTTNTTFVTPTPPLDMNDVNNTDLIGDDGNDGDDYNTTTTNVVNNTYDDELGNNVTRRNLLEFGSDGVGDDVCPTDLSCLTGTQWIKLLDTAAATGVKIVFTLNYLYHTRSNPLDPSTADQQPWDATNAQHLLLLTKQHLMTEDTMDTLYGFELGHEIMSTMQTNSNTIGGSSVLNLVQLQAAYAELRTIIDQTWADVPKADRPKILGPTDSLEYTAPLLDVLEDQIDVITYHTYAMAESDDIQSESDLLASNVTVDTLLDETAAFFRRPAQYSMELQTLVHSNVHVWIGQGAMVKGIGVAGLSNAFISTLWLANAMGSLVQAQPVGIRTYCRQELIGPGASALLQLTDTLGQPYRITPDFMLLYLWSKLVGTVALGPVQSFSPNLRVHAFCGHQDKSAVAVLVNLSPSTEPNLELRLPMGTTRDVYVLRGDPDAEGTQVRLNGVTQNFSFDGTLVSLDDAKQSATSDAFLILPPQTVAFVVMFETGIEACNIGGSASTGDKEEDPWVEPPKEDQPTAPAEPEQSNPEKDADDKELSQAAKRAIFIILGLMIIFLSVCLCKYGKWLCCCFYRGSSDEVIRRPKRAHAQLATTDLDDDGLMLDENYAPPPINIPDGDNDDGLL